MENRVRSGSSMSMSSSLYCIGSETISLVRSNAVLNTTTVNKALCNSTQSGFGRSIMRRKGKSTSKGSIYSSKNKVLPPSMMEAVHYNWPAIRWLADSPQEMVYYQVLSQFLLWPYQALSSDYSQTSLGEGKSMLLSPCITSIPTTTATFFTSQLVKERWLRKEAT